MAIVRYNGITIEPSPTVGINKDSVWTGGDTELSKIFNIELNGHLLPISGGVEFKDGTEIANEYMSYVFQKANSLRDTFSSPGYLLEVLDNDNTTVLSCVPSQISVNLPDNIYTTDVSYTVSCLAYNITSYVQGEVYETSVYSLKSASDEWTFSIQDDMVEVNRSIQSQGHGDGLDSDLAWLNASSWCHDRLNDVTFIDDIKDVLSIYFSSTFTDYSIRSMTINKSQLDGNYGISVIYNIPREGGSYIETYNVVASRAANDFLSLDVDYNVRGLGSNFAERLDNAKTKFGDLEPAIIMSSIFSDIQNSIPYNYSFNNVRYDVSNFNSTVSKPEGSLNYRVLYRITDLDVSALLDYIGLQSNVSFDYTNGKFNINVKGNYSNLQNTEWAQLTIPEYSDIMSYLSNKSIIPPSWSNQAKVVRVDKDFLQDDTIQNWTMDIEGDALSSSDLPVMISRSAQHTLYPSQQREEISESITVNIADVIFNPNSFALDDSLLSNMNTYVSEYVAGSSVPNSIYFQNYNRAPSMINCSVSKLDLSNNVTVEYQINRNWVLYPWEINYLPDNIPLESLEIQVGRNFDTRVMRDVPIPGRTYGPLFQNLNTFTTPSISISINLVIGRTLSVNPITSADIFPPTISGTDSFRTDIVFANIADDVLRSIVGNITIDRDVNPPFNISGPCAIITSEEDNYNPSANQYSYNITYALVNMTYS